MASEIGFYAGFQTVGLVIDEVGLLCSRLARDGYTVKKAPLCSANTRLSKSFKRHPAGERLHAAVQIHSSELPSLKPLIVQRPAALPPGRPRAEAKTRIPMLFLFRTPNSDENVALDIEHEPTDSRFRHVVREDSSKS